MMRFKLQAMMIVVGATLLAGCAAWRNEGEIDWERGAKRGWIASTFTADQAGDALPACVARIPLQERAGRRFAKLSYRRVRHLLVEVAEIDPASNLKEGDTVEFWPADCSTGALSRIGRVYPKAN